MLEVEFSFRLGCHLDLAREVLEQYEGHQKMVPTQIRDSTAAAAAAAKDSAKTYTNLGLDSFLEARSQRLKDFEDVV